MSSIQDVHAFATELFDLVAGYLMGYYSDDEVIAITCRDGEYVIEAGHPSRLEVNCTIEIYHFKELIRVGDDGFYEPDNDKLNDIANGWVFLE